MSMREAEAKAQELMLYVADRSVDDPGFGAVKLNKILFFSDFEAKARTGAAITGLDYQKLINGPALRRMLPLQQELIDRGDALLVPRGAGRFTQRRLVALREPDLSTFSGLEISIVDQMMAEVTAMNATQVSEHSHRWPGWLAADLGETIPYATAVWGPHELDGSDIERARELHDQAR